MTNRKILPRILDFIGITLVVIALICMAIGYISPIILSSAKELNDITSPYNFLNYSLALISLTPGVSLRLFAVYLKKIDPSYLIKWLVKIWLCAAGIPLLIWQVTIIYLFGFSRLQNILNPYNLLYYIPVFLIIGGPIFIVSFVGEKLHTKYVRTITSSCSNVGI